MLVLLLLLAATVALRSLALDRPLVGNFATKSVVYAMIARNWVSGRSTWAYPTLDCIVGGERSLHMLELPVSAYLTAAAWRWCGGSLDAWGRITAVVFSAAAVGVFYGFVRRRHGEAAAAGTGTVLALSPVSVIYGQSFMLEASLMFFTVAAFAALDRYFRQARTGWLVLAGVWLALALLTKIYMLVLLLPLAAMAWAEGRSRAQFAATLAVLFAAVVPAALWYAHASRTADPAKGRAHRVFYSVRQSAEVHAPPHPLLTSPDFYRRLLDDSASVVLTPIGLTLALMGLANRAWRRYLPWLLASAVLVALLPRKFYEMNYYYLAILPPLALLAGLGWQAIAEKIRPGRGAVAALLLVAVVFALRYAIGPAFSIPAEDRAVVAAGRAVDRLATADERVATLHGSGIDLLYYCNRPGWALDAARADLAARIEECRRQGARYLAVAGDRAAVGSSGVPVVEGDGFAVYRLTGAR
jgi:4-amino-4-deoxy-L-arabinose transferase-like glycosyltransferase